MSDTAFIYYAPHPAHRNFAESIDMDFYPLLSEEARPSSNSIIRMWEYVNSGINLPRGYDNYLLEGGRTLVSAAVFDLLNGDENIILLNADETFINIVEGVEHYGFGEAWIHKRCLPHIDALLNVGEFVGGYAQKSGMTAPSRTVYPSISDANYQELREVNPSRGSKNIVSVGVGKPSVGFDILVDAFDQVRTEHPSAELHIAGRDHPSIWNEREGVTVHGWVDSLADFFSKGELSVHPGRSECFPVSTLEPLCVGIPSVVSHMVGTKEVMSELDENLTTQNRVAAVSKAIDWYFTQPEDYREEIADSAREISTRFTEERCAADFQNQFNDLVSELSS